jgi:hypothetical protein
MAKKKNALSLMIGPPIVPPTCSRLKSVSGLPSDVFAVSASRRWNRRRPLRLVRARLRDAFTTRRGARTALAPVANLELLDGIQRDVDGRPLPAHLLAEKAVVVVAAVEADVVEHAPLACKRDFVSVRPLDDAHAGCQRQQILELAPEDRRGLDGGLVERARRRRALSPPSGSGS